MSFYSNYDYYLHYDVPREQPIGDDLDDIKKASDNLETMIERRITRIIQESFMFIECNHVESPRYRLFEEQKDTREEALKKLIKNKMEELLEKEILEYFDVVYNVDGYFKQLYVEYRRKYSTQLKRVGMNFNNFY